jgi:hypothetical protein
MALLGASAATGQEKAREFEKLGQVHFPVSCTAEAQKQFDRAVALLHSFWFDGSAKGFAAVIQTTLVRDSTGHRDDPAWEPLRLASRADGAE